MTGVTRKAMQGQTDAQQIILGKFPFVLFVSVGPRQNSIIAGRLACFRNSIAEDNLLWRNASLDELVRQLPCHPFAPRSCRRSSRCELGRRGRDVASPADVHDEIMIVDTIKDGLRFDLVHRIGMNVTAQGFFDDIANGIHGIHLIIISSDGFLKKSRRETPSQKPSSRGP